MQLTDLLYACLLASPLPVRHHEEMSAGVQLHTVGAALSVRFWAAFKVISDVGHDLVEVRKDMRAHCRFSPFFKTIVTQPS